VFYLEEVLKWYEFDVPKIPENRWICVALAVEHILSYASMYYRINEIKHFGRPDVNGVLRARNESIFGTIEVFFDCMLFGYIIKFLAEVDTIHNHPYYFYWIIIDCLIMFLSLAFKYLSNFMKISGEVTKNIYTLQYVQSQKLKIPEEVKPEDDEKDIFNNLEESEDEEP
jgi:hypothetical protein